ncbi:MAG: hypothetical protein K2G16_04150, partial [Lachnospiraceae bacterium]|nr:hypothetical protein [Lachnospiraceae bacterium]
AYPVQGGQNLQAVKSFLTQRQQQILTESKDCVNAPFLFEPVNEWSPFQKFIVKFDRNPTELMQFVEDMNKQVYINVANELERILGGANKVKAGDGQHYQAVNLEHVEDQGRIELRRFDAQENIGELLEQTDVLFEILQMARTNWKISIDKASTGDYFAG